MLLVAPFDFPAFSATASSCDGRRLPSFFCRLPHFSRFLERLPSAFGRSYVREDDQRLRRDGLPFFLDIQRVLRLFVDQLLGSWSAGFPPRFPFLAVKCTSTGKRFTKVLRIERGFSFFFLCHFLHFPSCGRDFVTHTSPSLLSGLRPSPDRFRRVG